MDSKSIFRSKTLLFNLLALVVLVANAYGYGSFEPSPEVSAIAPVVVIVGNLLLRLLTKQPIALGPNVASLAEPALGAPSALPDLLPDYQPLSQWTAVRCNSCKALTGVGTPLVAPYSYNHEQIGLSHCVVCGSSSVQAV